MDVISRQDAIDAVEHITSSMSVCVNTDECHGMKRMQRQAVIELANLPSAQSEIVRCKDCVYWWESHKMCTQNKDKNHNCACMDCDADFYCKNAERRKE